MSDLHCVWIGPSRLSVCISKIHEDHSWDVIVCNPKHQCERFSMLQRRGRMGYYSAELCYRGMGNGVIYC